MEAALRLSEGESHCKIFIACRSSFNTVDPQVSLCFYPSAGSNESTPATPDLYQDGTQAAAELAARNKQSVSWERPEGVGAGLLNTGNTCYLNAALQCLTHTPPLANYMLSREHSRSCCHQEDCTMCAMETHVTQSLLHSGDVMQPSRKLTATFHKDKQDDAHEFLMFTLNAMHESCLRGSKYSEGPSEDSSLIHEIFGGSCRSQIKCHSCQGTSDSVNPFLDIPLDINAAQSVNQALEDLVKPEELCGENAYHCDHCQEKMPASKTLTIKTASKVLLLVLNRFLDFMGGKVDRHVSYPQSLDLQPYMSQPEGGPLVYALYAVLVHAGVTCHFGHYFCYVRAGSGKWYKMDDSKVERWDVTSVLSEPAYVLFYVWETELKKDSVKGPVGTVNQAQVGQRQNRNLNRGSWVGAVEPQGHMENRAAIEFSLHEWKVLQEQNRQNPVLNLRRAVPTLPANAVVIHQPRYREYWYKKDPNKENYPYHNSARFLSAHGAINSGQLWCQGGTSSSRRRRRRKRRGKGGGL
ncbi:ubiquitin carboxyl-terminal hydrolase 17-like protein B [Peromyscus californicus insignis]|uniref:ubiquitin carboxyl-terminal hydrolase 17-like protein B n=1 Tax=Peromyscus californicus insignis TaxID=564181 RepID=UPI0022A6BB80|nr:ubiquitin carboxyl-terminal hydrolase 17-like protein B [Peromyscus californicus insignis]